MGAELRTGSPEWEQSCICVGARQCCWWSTPNKAWLVQSTLQYVASLSALFYYTTSECCTRVRADSRDPRESKKKSTVELISMGLVRWIMQVVKVILSVEIVGQPVPGWPSRRQRCVGVSENLVTCCANYKARVQPRAINRMDGGRVPFTLPLCRQ